MKTYLQKLQDKENLSQPEIIEIMKVLMSGEAAHADILEFLRLLRAKGATVEEITGAAQVLREFSLPVKTKHKLVLDTCGTGGDRRNTFNISTVTALVVAAGGVAVAKHGNRSVSSKCGSVDVLEALGVKLLTDPVLLGKCLDDVGIAFLFAQALHPAMKNVARARKELGVETIFNLLGPLLNPARATHQIMGIYSHDLVEPIAQVLKNLGLERALVVHGSDGLDEVTITGKTFVAEWTGKEIETYDIEPGDSCRETCRSAGRGFERER
jgi:anthranilate phosphoribosyltransferase